MFGTASVIFGAFLIVYFLVVTYGLYSRRGSGINQRPYRNPYGDAPGAWGSSSLSHDPKASIKFARGLR